MVRIPHADVLHPWNLCEIFGYKNTKTARDSSGCGGRICFSAEKPRRLRHATGMSLRAAFRIRPQYKKSNTIRCWTFCGGGGRIRTIEAKRSRFTVCPLWPLGNSPICNLARFGAGRRTRTPDLLITNQLLYQLSYTGVSNRTRLL